MANASNPISPSWATSINCPMEEKKNREKALSYQLVGVVISLFYCHLFSSRNSWPVYFQAFQWMQAIKFTADTQHGSSFGCSSCADWQKGSSPGEARFSDFTGITAEGSLEHTEHCMRFYTARDKRIAANPIQPRLNFYQTISTKKMTWPVLHPQCLKEIMSFWGDLNFGGCIDMMA